MAKKAAAKKAAKKKAAQAPAALPTVPEHIVIMCGDRVCVNRMAELAKAVGAPDAATLRLLQTHPDCPKKNTAKLYDVENWRAFWNANKGSLAEIASKDPAAGATKAVWDVRKVAAQARILELQEAERRGDMVTNDEAVQVLCELVKALADELARVPPAMASDLMGLDMPEFSKRLKTVHREALEKVFNGISVKKKAFWRILLRRASDLLQKSSPGVGPSGG